jgi:hypothetical protein
VRAGSGTLLLMPPPLLIPSLSYSASGWHLTIDESGELAPPDVREPDIFVRPVSLLADNVGGELASSGAGDSVFELRETSTLPPLPLPLRDDGV